MKIESNIPMPNSKIRDYSKLEIGDSFFVRLSEYKNIQSARAAVFICSKMQMDNSFKLTSRKTIEDGEEGIRFWRVA